MEAEMGDTMNMQVDGGMGEVRNSQLNGGMGNTQPSGGVNMRQRGGSNMGSMKQRGGVDIGEMMNIPPEGAVELRAMENMQQSGGSRKSKSKSKGKGKGKSKGKGKGKGKSRRPATKKSRKTTKRKTSK